MEHADNSDVSDYFDWLTEQQGMPAKPFDPLEELKQLRRKIALRLQKTELPNVNIPDCDCPADGRSPCGQSALYRAHPGHNHPGQNHPGQNAVYPEPGTVLSSQTLSSQTLPTQPSAPLNAGSFGHTESRPQEKEPISLDTALETVSRMKKTLAAHHQASRRAGQTPSAPFRSRWQHENVRQVAERLAEVARSIQNLDAPKENVLEKFNVGFISLGIAGVIFGILSFYRGWESDLMFGTVASASGAAIIAIGVGGQLLCRN